MRVLVKISVFTLLTTYTSSCGKGASDVLTAVFCGRGEHKSKMTVGLNLDSVKNALSLTQSNVSNDNVKDFLNGALKKVNISPQSFNVKSVESVGDDNDYVRFLQLDGSFGQAFGITSSYLNDAFKNATGLEFLQESFGVKMAVAEDLYYKNRAEQVLKKYAPFLLGDPQEFHKYQWAYDQTEYQASFDLYQKMKVHVKDKFKEVRVAVLDTGVDLDHPDLIDSLVKEDGKVLAYNPIKSGASADDDNGHGTHCAGIIGARNTTAESPVGVAAMAGVKIIPVKVLGEGGSGGFQEIEKGVRWATKVAKADILSLSLGAGLDNSDVDKTSGKIINGVFSDAIKDGHIIIVAAGNESCPLGGSCDGGGFLSKTFDEYTVLPCAYDGTICVGATDQDETLAEYSNFWSGEAKANYRTQADVNAPGTAIYSTWPGGGYKSISGTSMATPYVAGVAALIRSVVPDINQAQMMDILTRSQAFPDSVKDKSNEGRVDLYTALQITAVEKLGMDIEKPTLPPEPNPVTTAPPIESGGNATDLIGSLLSAVCSES